MPPNLQARVNEIHSMALVDSVQTMVSLLPGVKPSVSPKMDYLFTHPDFEGQADLNELGKYFLNNNRRCCNENASLQTRVLQQSMDDTFSEIYEDLANISIAGVKAGTIKPEPRKSKVCACCAGEPRAVLTNGLFRGDMFLFTTEQYREIWGDEENAGGTYSCPDGVPIEHWYASEEQIKEALARGSTSELSRL